MQTMQYLLHVLGPCLFPCIDDAAGQGHAHVWLTTAGRSSRCPWIIQVAVAHTSAPDACLQALPPDQNAAALLQHQPITEALATALVRRTELRPVALGTATADARDLPEDMRMVRLTIVVHG
jgi:hypothetical protein